MEAAEKFGVHKGIIRVWVKLRADPAVAQQFTRQMRKVAPKMEEEERTKVVEQINLGVLRISQASRTYGVSRNEINRWITIHTKINLKNTLKDPVYCSMTAEEKNKELEEQLRQAQKLLEEARLKISGLETLIEVAEEKFEIQIKKKHGSKPPEE
jgi:transposase-like protein